MKQQSGRAITGHYNDNDNNNNTKKKKNVVGIRCSQCGALSRKEQGNSTMAVFFPTSVQNLYRGVCTWQRLHFDTCEHMSNEHREAYKYYKDLDPKHGRTSYWIDSAHKKTRS